MDGTEVLDSVSGAATLDHRYTNDNRTFTGDVVLPAIGAVTSQATNAIGGLGAIRYNP